MTYIRITFNLKSMTREEAKEWLPIIQAWAEGKTIQYQINPRSRWTDIINDLYTSNPTSNYRIKPQPKYRPFKTQEECWNEMLKHQPFGWIKGNVTGEYKQVVRVIDYGEIELIFNIAHNSSMDYTSGMMFDSYTFIDGTPFGIKEE